MVVQGEAGIGKTELLKAAMAAGERRGLQLLRARGGEFEAAFAYGVVRQLFEPVLAGVGIDERTRLLSEGAAPAGPALGIDRPSGAADAFAVRHALYWLTAHLAGSRPLLVCVDDAHWADEASLQFLLHLLRRLEDLPVALVMAWRRGDTGGSAHLLAALEDQPGVEIVAPARLSADATAELVRRHLGADADANLCRACHQATGGNPFLLAELVRALHQEGCRPLAPAAKRVRDLAPRAVARSVLARLARLSPAARELATAVAVLGGDAEPRHAAGLAGLDRDQAEEALAALAAAGIVEAGPEILSFLHPILASAVAHELGPSALALAHVRAARLLDAAGAGRRAAAHLLVAERSGDPWVVDRLAAAAHGAPPDEAAALLARALDEPPSSAQRPGILVALGEAERLAGRPGAIGHLREAVALAADPDLRERAVCSLAHMLALAGQGDEAVSVVEAQIDVLSGTDAERARRLEGVLAQVAITSHPALGRLVPRLEALVSRAGGQERRAAAGALLLRRYDAAEAPPEHLVALAEEALGGEAFLDDAASGSLTPSIVLLVLARIDCYDRAREVAGAVLGEAEEHGLMVGAALALAWRGHVEVRAGCLAAAQADLETALRIVEAAEIALLREHVLGNLVETLVLRGELDEAEALLAGHGIRSDEQRYDGHLLVGRGRLHLARDRPAEAAADARAALAIADARGVVCRALGLRPLLAGALLALGQRDEALALVEDELEVALRNGTPAEVGTARRARAAIAGSPSALDELARAVQELAATPRRLEHAAALVELGAALRRANRRAEARLHLADGLELAGALGAGLLAQRAGSELAAAGARPRRQSRSGLASLTPAELRVAELAATGLSNVDIARRLFVNRKTVETQLSSTYRKLGVDGREGLPGAIGRTTQR